MSESDRVLEYRAGGERRRAWWRSPYVWVTPLLLVTLGPGGMWVRGQWEAYRARQWWAGLVRAVATDAPGAEVVAYEDESTRAAALGSRPGYVTFNGWEHRPRAGRVPRAWYELRYECWGLWDDVTADAAILFAHERRTAGGTRWVVIVYTKPSWPDGGTRAGISAEAFAVAGADPSRSPPTMVRFRDLVTVADADRAVGNGLRVFAGQADPADASRFTIGYEVDGRRGVVEGWVKDSGEGVEVVMKDRG